MDNSEKAFSAVKKEVAPLLSQFFTKWTVEPFAVGSIGLTALLFYFLGRSLAEKSGPEEFIQRSMCFD